MSDSKNWVFPMSQRVRPPTTPTRRVEPIDIADDSGFDRPDWDKCAATTRSGTPCKNPAPPSGNTCAAGHEPVHHKKELISLSGLKSRGWTAAMIRDLLGEPDKQVPNPHYRQAAPMKLYYLFRVGRTERTKQFRQAKEKADRRRESSRKGLQAAGAINAAKAALTRAKRKVVEEEKIEGWSYDLESLALDPDPKTTMKQRKSYRRDSNAMRGSLGMPMCRACKWRHTAEQSCSPSILDVHREARMGVQIDAVFDEPD